MFGSGPNISGFSGAGSNDTPSDSIINGAFSLARNTSYRKTLPSTMWANQPHASYLDASSSVSTYGKSTTVQPSSVRFLPCIKA
mgnify:CR=1 FL=1